MAASTVRSIKSRVKACQGLTRAAISASPENNFLCNSVAEKGVLPSSIWRRSWSFITDGSRAVSAARILKAFGRAFSKAKEGKIKGIQVAKMAGREHCMLSSHNYGGLHTQAEAVAACTSREIDELADIDWDGLGFGLRQTDYMYVMKCGKDMEFYEGDVQPFGTIELSPSAGVLNYAQGLFEGLKAYRTLDGRIILFRPEENALRMEVGAERLCMPAPSVEQFVNAVRQTVLANKRWIPPAGKGALYIRVLLMGSGPVLGLGPAPEVTFLIFVSPVGNYFKEGLAPIQLHVETKHHRATPGGTGGIKSITNYAPMLRVQYGAKAKGFTDVLYLDSINKKYIEEVSSCNIFVVKDNLISTPSLHGTILPGITRKSIITLARSRGYKVEERRVSVDELLAADEVFCTGTAVVVSPVGSVTYLDKRVTYRNGDSGGFSQELHSTLTNIQMGLAEDSMGWTMELK